jgi:predicted aspartyl protease
MCKAKRVDAVISNEKTFEEETLFVHTAVAALNSGDWYEKVTINGERIVLKLNTGAQCNFLPLNLARRLRLTVSVSKTENVISFNGERTKI